MEKNEDSVFKKIRKLLNNLEIEYNIQILFAIESGSRAWGFESPNSDYDVRFVYCYPKSFYLSIDPITPAITRMYENGTFDLNGWDIFKYAKLLVKSNPQTLEWVYSPIQYIPVNDSKLQELTKYYFSQKALFYHHYSLTKQNYNKFIENKSLVSPKKYLYCLRSYYSALFVLHHHDIPPIKFDELITKLGDKVAISEELEELIKLKMSNKEDHKIKPILAINDLLKAFVAKEITLEGREVDTAPVNKWINSILK